MTPEEIQKLNDTLALILKGLEEIKLQQLDSPVASTGRVAGSPTPGGTIAVQVRGKSINLITT